MHSGRGMRVGANAPAIKVDLALIPLKQQVNVIWLSKVIPNKQLGERTGITPLYIKCILEYQTEILKRWKEATTTMNKEMKEERNDHNAIRLILLEWAKRSLWNGNKNIDPTIIEEKANELKLLFHTGKYSISSDFWKEYKAFKMQNVNNKRKHVIHSLDTLDVLSSCKSKIPSETYEKFSKFLVNHTFADNSEELKAVNEFIRENNKHINFRKSSEIEDDNGDKEEHTLLDQLIYKWCIRHIAQSVGPPLEYKNVSVLAHRLKHQLNLRTYIFTRKIWIHVCAFRRNQVNWKRPTNPHLSLDFAQILKEHTFEVSHKTIRKFLNILENFTEPNTPRTEYNRTYTKTRNVTPANASCTQPSVVMTTGQERENVAVNSTSSSNCLAKGRKSLQANLGLPTEDILNETHEDIQQKLESSEHFKTPRVFNAATDTDEESLQSVLPNYNTKFVYTNDDDVLVTISDNGTKSKQKEPELELKENLLGNITTLVDNHENKTEIAETESTKPETKEETVAMPKEEEDEEFMEYEEEFISCRATNNDKGGNESEANTILVSTTNALENVFIADLDENGCIEVLEIIEDEDDGVKTEDMSQKNKIEINQEHFIGNFANINNTTTAVSIINQEESLIHSPTPGQQNMEVHLVANKADVANKICTKPAPSSSIRKEKKPKRTRKRYKFRTPRRKYKEKKDTNAKQSIEDVKIKDVGIFKNTHNDSSLGKDKLKSHTEFGQQNVEVPLGAKKADATDNICTKPAASSSICKEKKPNIYDTPKGKYKEKKDKNVPKNIDNIKITDFDISKDSASLEISHNDSNWPKNKLKSHTAIGQQNVEVDLGAQKPDANDNICTKSALSSSTRKEKKPYKFCTPKRKGTNGKKNVENVKIKDIDISKDSASLEIFHKASSLRKNKLNSMMNKSNLQNIKENPIENNTGGDAQNKENPICTKKKPNKHKPKKDKTDNKKSEVYLQIVDGAHNTSLSFLVNPICSGDNQAAKGNRKSNKNTPKIDNQNIETPKNVASGVTDDEDCQITGVSFIQGGEHSISAMEASEGGGKQKEKHKKYEFNNSSSEFNSAAIENGVAADDRVTANSLANKVRNSKQNCTNMLAGYKDVKMMPNIVQLEIINDERKNVNPLKTGQNSFCAKENPENIQSNLYLDQCMATEDEDCKITGVSFIQGGEHSIYPTQASEGGGGKQKEKHTNVESMKSNIEFNAAAIENDDRVTTNLLVHKMRNSNHSKKNCTNISGEHEDLESNIHHPNAVQFEKTSSPENIQSSFCLEQETVNQTSSDYHLMAVSIASETENVIIKPKTTPATPKVLLDGKRKYIDKENQILNNCNNMKLSKKPKYPDKKEEHEELKEDNNGVGVNIHNDSNDHNPQRKASEEKDNGEEINSDNSNVEIHLEIVDDDEEIDENVQKANVSLLQKYQNSSGTTKALKYSQPKNRLGQKLAQKADAVNESDQTAITVSKAIERENLIETPKIKKSKPKSINKEDNKANFDIKSLRIADPQKFQNEIASTAANSQKTICTKKSRPDIQNKEKLGNNGYPYSKVCQTTNASVQNECKNVIKSLKRNSSNHISGKNIAKEGDYPLDANIEIHLEIIDDNAVEESKQNEDISLVKKSKTAIFKDVPSAMKIHENCDTITNNTNSNNKVCEIADISIPKADLKNVISTKNTNKVGEECKGNYLHENYKNNTKAHQKIVNDEPRINISLLNKSQNLVLSQKPVAKNIKKEKIDKNFVVKQEIDYSSTAALICLRRVAQKVLSKRKYESSEMVVDDRKTSLRSPATITSKPMVIIPNDVNQYNTNIVVQQEMDYSKTDLTIPLKNSTQKVLGKGKYDENTIVDDGKTSQQEMDDSKTDLTIPLRNTTQKVLAKEKNKDSEMDTDEMEVHIEIVDDRKTSQKGPATIASKPMVIMSNDVNHHNTNIVLQQTMDDSKTDLTIPLKNSTQKVLGKGKYENSEMDTDEMDTEVYIEIVDDNADDRNESQMSPATTPSKPKAYKQKDANQYNTNIVEQQEKEDSEIDSCSQTTEVHLEIVDDYADDRNKSQKSPATTITNKPKAYEQKDANHLLNTDINQTEVGCGKAKMKTSNHPNNSNKYADDIEDMHNSNIEIHLEIVDDNVVGEKPEIENISDLKILQNSICTKENPGNGQGDLKLDQVMINSNSLLWAKKNPRIHSSNEEKEDINNQTVEVHLEIVDGDAAAAETSKDASIYLQKNENDFPNIKINQVAKNKGNVAKIDGETLIYTKQNLPGKLRKCLEQDTEQDMQFKRIRLERKNENNEIPTHVQSKLNANKPCPTKTDSNNDITTTRDIDSNQNVDEDEAEESLTILEIIPDGELPNEVLNHQDVITYDPMDILNILQRESVNKFNNQSPQMHDKSSGAQTKLPAEKPLLKNTSEAVIYLSKLKDFFVRQKNPIGIKLVLNLELSFFCGDLIDDDD